MSDSPSILGSPVSPALGGGTGTPSARRSRRRVTAAASALAIAGLAASLSATSGSAQAAQPVRSAPAKAQLPALASISGQFAGWAQAPGVQAVSGDFNGDGRDDIALVGGAGWATVPVAFSRGNGTFNVTNRWVANLPVWAQAAGVKVLAGDFNGDGRDDLALVGGPGWATVPVGFSLGNGYFSVTNQPVPNLPVWAQAAGVKAVAGDFNRDGRADIALVGGPGWATVPVGFSRGNGTFAVTNRWVANLPVWAQAAGVQVVAGDFNGDRRTDIALTGGPGWATVPVGFSLGNGYFSVTNQPVANLPVWAQAAGVKAVAGDFNRDGRADIALTGGPGWATVPVGFSIGGGNFAVTNRPVANLPVWAQAAGVKVVAGDFNRDGRTDIALTGGPGWWTLPVGFSIGGGYFNVTNWPI